MTRDQEWTPEIIERLRLVAGVISQAIVRTRSHVALQNALDEIKSLRDRLSAENVELRREVRVLRTSGVLVSDSSPMQRVLAQVEQVAPTPATVLLLGETGTGKEVMAQAIHNLSPRHTRPMVRVSCAAIPTALIESELFGRERGAYTGALSRQIGRFEAANQSTLFLDEIGDLPMEVQVKLLRVLQERVIERLGSTQPIKVDVRIIAATNRNLEDAVNDKTFREDLFYRLNVFPIVVPPLRERVERHSRTGVELHRRVLEIVRQDDRLDFQGQHARAPALPLAGKRPRAAQRHRTRGHHFHRPPAGGAGAPAAGTDAQDGHDADRRSKWNTFAACSKARTGASADRAAPRSASGSSRRRSKAGWPGWASRASARTLNHDPRFRSHSSPLEPWQPASGRAVAAIAICSRKEGSMRRFASTPAAGMRTALWSSVLAMSHRNSRNDSHPRSYELPPTSRMTIEWSVPLGQTRPITMALHSVAADVRSAMRLRGLFGVDRHRQSRCRPLCRGMADGGRPASSRECRHVRAVDHADGRSGAAAAHRVRAPARHAGPRIRGRGPRGAAP